MTVSNNKVKNAYNYKIGILGGTYSNEKLNAYTNHARLSFKVTAKGVGQTNCWLQDRVTGKNNNINISYSM